LKAFLVSHAVFGHSLAIIANAIIAIFHLRFNCEYRIYLRMDNATDTLIDALGGTTAVANGIHSPVSTVHSWRKNGIPLSRLAHMRLVFTSDDHAAAFALFDDSPDHGASDTTSAAVSSPGNSDDFTAEAAA
jgi:hypothetical protein